MSATDSALYFSQAHRLLAIDSPLSQDQLLLTELDGHDAISRPFSFRVEFATHQPDDEVRTLLGKSVTLWFGATGGVGRRPANGLVRRLSGPLAAPRGLRRWRADVVPQLWFLTRTADCRIFQEMSIPDIIKTVFARFNLTDYEFRGLLGTYPKLDYCVQYRETAFDFVSRLMEHVGMFYWHEQSDSKHQLVITDNNNVAPAARDPSVVMAVRGDLGQLLSVESEFNYRTGLWTLEDYDFTKPATDLRADTPTTLQVPRMSEYEIYDYPGLYHATAVGTALTRLRIEQEEAEYHRVRGDAATPGFDAGAYTVLEDADADQPNWKVLLTEVRHRATDTSDLISQGGTPPSYHCAFTAIPFTVPYRPARITPKPFVRGLQTAKVTGPAGENIYTDQYGRVKVRFHWDRNPDGDADENSSCWLRVSQIWAGEGWGAIHLPRVGQEVIVDFLEGDPDHPIITGRVYNAVEKVPFDLDPAAAPANASPLSAAPTRRKTWSGIKSRSTPGGGHNEFLFVDDAGKEEVFLRAQKDLSTLVEHDEQRHVKHDRTTNIDHDEAATIGHDKTTTVTNNFSETIQGTETRSVIGNVSETFAANETRMISGNVTETITGNVDQTVSGMVNQLVTGPVTVTSFQNILLTGLGGSVTTEAASWWQNTPMAGQATALAIQIAALNLQAYGVSMQNAGVNIGNSGVNMGITGVNLNVTGAQLTNTPIDLGAKAAIVNLTDLDVTV